MKEIYAENSGSNYELLAAGSYVARCVSMIELGTQKVEYQDKMTMQKKVRLTWEMPTEKKVFKQENGEQPYVISKEMTLSLNEKANLRKFLESWRGKAFTEDESKKFNICFLLERTCLLNIIHKDKKDGNKRLDIASISQIPKGMICPEQINKTVCFTLSSYTDEEFNSLPNYIQETIKKSAEYELAHKGIQTPVSPEFVSSTEPDDLPF